MTYLQKNDKEKVFGGIIDTNEMFPTDPPLFKFYEIRKSGKLRRELCLLGPCQPRTHDLKPCKGSGRTFQDDWYHNAGVNDLKTDEDHRDRLVCSTRLISQIRSLSMKTTGPAWRS